MAAGRRNIFPAFSYPFYPHGTHQQSFVDYGSMSCYDIHIDEDDKSVYTASKHTHGEASTFVARHPTIPFFGPSSTVYSSRNFPAVKWKVTATKTDFEYPMIDQISGFYIDNPDVTFPVGQEVVNNECKCEPWSLRCLFQDVTRQSNTLDKPRYNQGLFARSFVSLPLRKSAGLFCGKNEVEMPKGLGKALFDIPPQLIFNLTNESMEQQKQETLYFDIFQGNTLSYCQLPSNQSLNGVLFYPSGPNLDTLNLSSVVIKHNDEDESISKPALVEPCLRIPLNSAIRQIDSVGKQDNILVVARTQYCCSFFRGNMGLEVVDTFESEDEFVDISLSPYIHGEAVITTSQGDIHIWNHGKTTDTHNVPSPAVDERWPWYQSIYAGHPRSILVANPVEVDLFDIRGSRPSSCFLSINSREVDLHERISALQRHPDNTHHYVIATDQSLLIMDDRFLQHPVLKWHHHLQDPVQFIDIVPGVVPNCNDTVVVVSGSVHHESHFYQYSSGQSIVSPAFIDGSVVTPPVSTCLPWKMLSYDKWPSLLPYSDLPLSSVLDNRLTKALIGVTCIPDNETGFCVLQMSELGDIFYQTFGAKNTKGIHSSGIEQQNTFQLSKSDKEFCQDWITDLIALEQRYDANKNCDLKLNMLETDCIDKFEELTHLETPHESCVLCSDSYDEQYDGSFGEDVCERCGIDIATGRQLVTAAQQNDILTSRTYTMNKPAEPVHLNIFPDERTFQNSLSEGFRQNWLSDKPMPIDHTIQNETSEENNQIETSHNNAQSSLEQELVKGGVETATSTSVDISLNVTSSEATANTTPIKSGTSSTSISQEITITTPTQKQSTDAIATPGSGVKNKSIVKSKRKIGLSMGF